MKFINNIWNFDNFIPVGLSKIRLYAKDKILTKLDCLSID